MRHRTLLIAVAFVSFLLVSTSASAVKPADALASGWVISPGSDDPIFTEEFEVQVGDKIVHEKFTVEEDIRLDGVLRFGKGQRYNAFRITRDGEESVILWVGVDDAVLWNIDAEVIGASGKIRAGDRVEIRVTPEEGKGLKVTVDMFRPEESIANFSFLRQ